MEVMYKTSSNFNVLSAYGYKQTLIHKMKTVSTFK